MNRAALLGAGVLGLVLIGGVAAPLLAAAGLLRSPVEITEDRLQPPSLAHPLGTDAFGRDQLSRVLHGARPALSVSVIATVVALMLGLPAGMLAGARGGIWDLTLTRLMEATAAIPSLTLVMLVVSLTLSGRGPDAAPSVALAAAIGLTRWATIARHVRAGIWKARSEDYASAALALGATPARLLGRHLLPEALTPAFVSAAFGAGSAVLIEAALSYLGLGAPAPAASWGRMIAESIRQREAWWLIAAPGIAVAVLVTGFNLLAEGMRLGPRGRPVVVGESGAAISRGRD